MSMGLTISKGVHSYIHRTAGTTTIVLKPNNSATNNKIIKKE